MTLRTIFDSQMLSPAGKKLVYSTRLYLALSLLALLPLFLDLISVDLSIGTITRVSEAIYCIGLIDLLADSSSAA